MNSNPGISWNVEVPRIAEILVLPFGGISLARSGVKWPIHKWWEKIRGNRSAPNDMAFYSLVDFRSVTVNNSIHHIAQPKKSPRTPKARIRSLHDNQNVAQKSFYRQL
jgi:hypothetical protein